MFFAQTLARVATPVREVSWADFLLADVLTSLSKALSDLERASCHLLTGPIMAPQGPGQVHPRSTCARCCRATGACVPLHRLAPFHRAAEWQTCSEATTHTISLNFRFPTPALALGLSCCTPMRGLQAECKAHSTQANSPPGAGASCMEGSHHCVSWRCAQACGGSSCISPLGLPRLAPRAAPARNSCSSLNALGCAQVCGISSATLPLRLAPRAAPGRYTLDPKPAHPSDALGCAQVCGSSSWILPLGLALPYAWRLAQCLRVFRDTGARPQLFNALKYSTAFPVILFSALKYQARPPCWSPGLHAGLGLSRRCGRPSLWSVLTLLVVWP